MWVFGGPYENVRRQMSVVRGDGIDMLISCNKFFPVFIFHEVSDYSCGLEREGDLPFDLWNGASNLYIGSDSIERAVLCFDGYGDEKTCHRFLKFKIILKFKFIIKGVKIKL